jgi:hypothetical protein
LRRTAAIARSPDRGLLLFALLVACSTQHGGATAQVDELHTGNDSRASIRYRTLERADFEGKKPPLGAVAGGNHGLAAITCVDVRAEPPISMQIGEATASDGTERFEGWLGQVRFQAFMDRDCSWWSPNTRSSEYTLQHEQIHFAIREIAARRLNASAERLAMELHVVAATEQEVRLQLRHRVEELFNEHNEAAVHRSREFDDDTSATRDNERQRQWWLQVERELEETADWR